MILVLTENKMVKVTNEPFEMENCTVNNNQPEPVVVVRDSDGVIEFIDFCIERNKDIKQELELMFMYYMKQKLKSD
jgi:hypothetical protein